MKIIIQDEEESKKKLLPFKIRAKSPSDLKVLLL